MAVPLGTRLMEAQLSARAFSITVAGGGGGGGRQRGEEAGEASPAVKCFQLELTRTPSAHISLVKASQMVTSNFQGAGKCSPLSAVKEREAMSVASSGV